MASVAEKFYVILMTWNVNIQSHMQLAAPVELDGARRVCGCEAGSLVSPGSSWDPGGLRHRMSALGT